MKRTRHWKNYERMKYSQALTLAFLFLNLDALCPSISSFDYNDDAVELSLTLFSVRVYHVHRELRWPGWGIDFPVVFIFRTRSRDSFSMNG